MAGNATAKVSFTKRELASLLAIVEKEKERYDAIDYDQLDDDEAGDVGDEHEVIDGIFSMLKASYSDTF
ncbi:MULTISPECIES: hypothetical protein [unclassified Microbulbifer]|uniref:hypothetical protein n=1 Tax=unclassified Microbulbifer TaxID=2619833 RepID=UPI0027E3BB95|nr:MULTISPECIES: hypothetical protein [unclassified Microbulbifer]